nr:helix-turn-helix domain-containing protein [Paracoccus fontiphilus]
MGWVMMSERDLSRAAVLRDVVAGRLRASDAAVVLNLSRRQLHRLLVRFGTEGVAGLTHCARGRAPNEAKSGHGMTQCGRALCELNIEILCANSSQAKGRVERANRTLQDRLVKELRLAGISDMEAANAFLPGFMARHNGRFAYAPARSDDLHRPLNMAASRLKNILCARDQRQVGHNLVVHYERRKFILEDSPHARSAIGHYVETYAHADRGLEIRWKGVSLPYRAFDPSQQRATHASITENKRLCEVLSWVMARQEAASPEIGPIGKQRTRYTPTGKRGSGRKSWLDKRAERRAAEVQAAQILQPPAQ